MSNSIFYEFKGTSENNWGFLITGSNRLSRQMSMCADLIRVVVTGSVKQAREIEYINAKEITTDFGSFPGLCLKYPC